MPQNPLEFVFFAIVVMLAGYVRGYGGFGFSMITVSGLALLLSPAIIIPAVLLLEIAASAYLIVGNWRKVAWRSLGWLSIGVLLGTPVGGWLLSILPENFLKIMIAAIVVCLAGLLRAGYRPRQALGKSGTVATGLVSGVFNGSTALGGPPVVLFFFSSPGGVDISRASLIAFFLGTELVAIGTFAGMGLITMESVRLFFTALIPMGVGLAVGKRSFIQADQTVFRQKVMLYLMLLAGLLFAQAIVAGYQ